MNPPAQDTDAELAPATPQGGIIRKPAEFRAEPQPWGRLVWMVSSELGNSETMTVGTCYIDVGRANPRHYHPNCDEILRVVRGTIEHSVGDQRVVMNEGDVISIPTGAVHNARNVGEVEAELAIMFSTGTREVVGE